MRVGKVLSIAVVSLAGLIVFAAAVAAIAFFAPRRRNDNQQNFAPAEGKQAMSPQGDTALVSQTSGKSSFLYRKNTSSGKRVRLTSASNGIESEASFSHDGKFVVYSFADSSDSKSSVWMVGADGSNPHALTGNEEDALHPVFSPNDAKVFYAASNFTGHYSPIVHPARHDWDVFSMPIREDATKAASAHTQITHSSFYDLQSLDVAVDPITPGAVKLVISTTGYPIGALLEEFIIGSTGRDKIFQPHVPNEPSTGPAYGGARFLHGGMDILFLAATDASGGNFDYNLYSMSDVTGTDIKQLTHLRGMTTELKVLSRDKVAFVNGGVVYSLDIGTNTAQAP